MLLHTELTDSLLFYLNPTEIQEDKDNYKLYQSKFIQKLSTLYFFLQNLVINI